MTKFIICLVIIICGSLVGGHVIKDKSGCFVKYLKSRGSIETDFPSVPYDGPKEVCLFMVGLVENIFYESVRENIDQIDKSTEYEHCIMAELKKSRALEYLLKFEVYQSATHLTSEEKEDKMNEMERGSVEEITRAAVKCQTDKDYRAMFDDIYNTEDSSEETEDEDRDEYCIRKYVVDNQLVDAKYEVKINPKEIDVSQVICEPIVTKFLASLQEGFTQGMLENKEITPEFSDCAKGKMVDLKAFDKIISLFIIKDLALTDEQKNEEREVFVNLMTKVKLEIRRTCDI